MAHIQKPVSLSNATQSLTYQHRFFEEGHSAVLCTTLALAIGKL